MSPAWSGSPERCENISPMPTILVTAGSDSANHGSFDTMGVSHPIAFTPTWCATTVDEIDFDNVAGSGRTKTELLQMKRERDKLEKTLGGIRDMSRTPSAVWIVDTKKEHLAVEEARKLRIPIIGILDTNCDPDEVDYPIPGNDDASKSIAIITNYLTEAIRQGLEERKATKTEKEAVQ